MNPNDNRDWGSFQYAENSDGFGKPDLNTDQLRQAPPHGWDNLPDPRLSEQPSDLSPSDWASRLTETDKRIVKECNDEAFYRRGLPLAALTVGTNSYVHVIQKKLPVTSVSLHVKNLFLGGLAFVVGKLMYTSVCLKKIESLREEDSFLKRKLVESKSNQKSSSSLFGSPERIQTPLRPYEATKPFEPKPSPNDRFSHLPDLSQERPPSVKTPPSQSPESKFKFDDDKPFQPYSDDEYRPKSF